MRAGQIRALINSDLSTPLNELTQDNFNILFENRLSPFFGRARDGDFNSTGDITPTLKEGFAIFECKNFTLNEGHTLTTTDTNKGIIIYCDGACTINGIINQTGKAFYASLDLSGKAWEDFSAVDINLEINLLFHPACN